MCKLTNIIQEEIQKLDEGAWGHGPLDNDSVSDWKWVFGKFILDELKKKLKGNDTSYKYYAIGLWEFFKERLETNYSFFSDDEKNELDELTIKAAQEILEDDKYINSYSQPDYIKKYLENYVNMLQD